MITVEELKASVDRRFRDVEVIEDRVVRFARVANGRPFSSVYIDIGPDIPSSHEQLASFQERIIAPRYFDGNKSLQWNNYLYFVRDDIEFEDISDSLEVLIRDIESDRSFARKRVIRLSQVEAVIDPPVVSESIEAPAQGLVSVWEQILDEAGIRDAVVSDERMPARLRKIETSSPASSPSKSSNNLSSRAALAPAQAIRSLALNRFRPFPLQRNFTFGRVNLFFGVNGTGKTSLLEAIEMLYCGRTKRNPKSNEAYDLSAVFNDGTPERASSGRALQLFRDRNLSWYGQPEVNTANIYRSFAQFNFLDTDAAVGLATSTDAYEGDLSKLLVGPDAARIWENVLRLSEEVAKELRSLKELRRQINDELASIDAILAPNSDDAETSTALFEEVRQSWSKEKWLKAPIHDKESLAKLVVDASQIERAARRLQAMGRSDLVSAVDFREHVKTETLKLRELQAALDAIEKTAQERAAALSAKSGEEVKQRALLRLKPYFGNDIRRLHRQLSAIEIKRERLSRIVGAVDEEKFVQLLPILAQPATLAYQGASSYCEDLEQDLEKDRAEFAEIERSLGLVQSLTIQLRAVAMEIVKVTGSEDNCPLCHSHFAPGQLIRHIQQELESVQADGAARLRERIAEKMRVVEAARSQRSCLEALVEFGRKLPEVAEEVSVGYLVEEFKSFVAELAKAETEKSHLEKAIDGLRSAGLSEADLQTIEAEIVAFGLSVPHDRSDLDKALQLCEETVVDLSRSIAIGSARNTELQQSIVDALRLESDERLDLHKAVADFEERISSAKAALAILTSHTNLEAVDSVMTLLLVLKDLREKATQVQDAVISERALIAQKREASIRRSEAQSKLNGVVQRGRVFQNAQKALLRIKKEHSLVAAVDGSLKDNRVAIESIFSQIHSPAEFDGIGERLGQLLRCADNRPTSLSEISTGQRAAYALSIFLAQNAQLRLGPPVILIDDPVAHVDDLNFLSLLDYLREVVVKSDRQIFFATANEKVANLFQRKFDFLGGEGYRRFELSR